MRNKKFIADLSQIFYQTKGFMDETMLNKFSDHTFPDLLAAKNNPLIISSMYL
jgi:hypothetical protein